MALVGLNFENKNTPLRNSDVTVIFPIVHGSGRSYPAPCSPPLFGSHRLAEKTDIELDACEKPDRRHGPLPVQLRLCRTGPGSDGFLMYDDPTEGADAPYDNWFPASSQRKDNFIAGPPWAAWARLRVQLPRKILSACIMSSCPREICIIRFTSPGLPHSESAGQCRRLEAYLASPQNVW